MGRKSLNKTYEQILEEKRIYSMKYYTLHRDEINKKVMSRYNKLKNDYVKKINSQ